MATASDSSIVNNSNKTTVAPMIQQFMEVLKEEGKKERQASDVEINKLKEQTNKLQQNRDELEEKFNANKADCDRLQAELQSERDRSANKIAILETEIKEKQEAYSQKCKELASHIRTKHAEEDLQTVIKDLSKELPISFDDVAAIHNLITVIATRVEELQKFQVVLSQFLRVSSDLACLSSVPDSADTKRHVLNIFLNIKSVISAMKKDAKDEGKLNPKKLKDYMASLCKQIDGVTVVTYPFNKIEVPFLYYNGSDNSTVVVIKLLNVLSIGCLNKIVDELNADPLDVTLKTYMFNNNCNITGLLEIITSHHKNCNGDVAGPASAADPAEPAKPAKSTNPTLNKRNKKRAGPAESANPDEHTDKKRAADD